jgi:hypothetical protein
LGVVKSYVPEKLVMGILISDLDMLRGLKLKLKAIWGELDSCTEAVEFNYTDYYNAEMGSPLYRIFCSFSTLVNPEHLAKIKLKSNEVENRFIRGSGRVINLDPGILSQSKFILATTKNNAHRIPMSLGIYGELTLQYRNGEFRDLEWTYPDYRGQAARQYLLSVRNTYKEQLKSISHKP